MILKIPAEKRHSQDLGWLKTNWLFSFSNYYDPNNIEFGALRVFNDDIVGPGGGFPAHPHDNMEIVTIVLSGKLTHGDNMGNEEIISAGEIQKMSAGDGVIHSEFNKHKEPVHLYQIWFYPNKKTTTDYQQEKIKTKENGLTLLASENNKSGITIESDATMYQLNLKKSEYKYKLGKNKGLFVYITSGTLFINYEEYKEGDQARIIGEEKLNFISKNNLSAILIEVNL